MDDLGVAPWIGNLMTSATLGVPYVMHGLGKSTINALVVQSEPYLG